MVGFAENMFEVDGGADVQFVRLRWCICGRGGRRGGVVVVERHLEGNVVDSPTRNKSNGIVRSGRGGCCQHESRETFCTLLFH